MQKVFSSPVFYKIVFALSFFVLFFVSSITYRQLKSLNESERMLRLSDRVHLELEQLFSYVKDAETSHRGYILTADSIYLQPYFDAQIHIRNSLSELSYLTKDSDGQSQNLQLLNSLIKKRLGFINQVLDRNAATSLTREQLAYELSLGRQTMYRIRILMNSMIRLENQLLKTYQETHSHDVFFTPLAALLISLFSLVVLIASFVKINSDRKQMARLHKQAADATLLSEHARVYRELVEGLPAAVYTCDTEGKIRLYNKAAVQLWGKKPEDDQRWCGSSGGTYTDGTVLTAENNPSVRLLRGEGIDTREMIIARPDGEKRNVIPHPQLLLDSKGNVAGVLNMLLDVTDQRINEEKLVKSEKLFKSIALNIPNSLILVIDKEYRILALEGDVLEKMGYDQQDYEGKLLSETMDQERYAEVLPFYQRVLEGEQFTNERSLEDDIFKLHFVPLKTETGETYAGLIIGLNISDYRRTEYRIGLLSSIVESSDDAIVSKTLEGIVTSWNAGAERIFGYTEAEMVGQHISIIIPEDRKDEETAIITKLTRGIRTDHFETQRQRKDGQIIDVSLTISPIRDNEGNIIGASKIARDISEQKRAEHVLKNFTEELERQVKERTEELNESNIDLKQQKEFAETILDTSIDITIVYDTEMRFISFNKAAERLYKKTKDEVLGKTLLEVYPHIDGHKGYQDLQRAIAGDTIHNTRYLSPITNLYYEDFLIPLYNNTGKIYAVLVLARDITQTIRNEELLLELNNTLISKNTELERSNTELASFNHVASHDLQEPLRKIQTFISRIQVEEGGVISAKDHDYLKRIRSSANRMQELIDDLLAFSRTNKSDRRFEPVDLNATLTAVKKELSQAFEETGAKLTHGPLPALKGIPFQFQQLFTNLIGNAIKYSRPDVVPHIHIHADTVISDNVPFLNGEASEYHRITVSDNGIGFEQQYAEQIFELFQRLHGKSDYSGTGIGLTICKRIVENHDGVIRASGELGEGAKFEIYLPVLN